jgi:hypothetical protein
MRKFGQVVVAAGMVFSTIGALPVLSREMDAICPLTMHPVGGSNWTSSLLLLGLREDGRCHGFELVTATGFCRVGLGKTDGSRRFECDEGVAGMWGVSDGATTASSEPAEIRERSTPDDRAGKLGFDDPSVRRTVWLVPFDLAGLEERPADGDAFRRGRSSGGIRTGQVEFVDNPDLTVAIQRVGYDDATGSHRAAIGLRITFSACAAMWFVAKADDRHSDELDRSMRRLARDLRIVPTEVTRDTEAFFCGAELRGER